jgi:competence protein ComEC
MSRGGVHYPLSMGWDEIMAIAGIAMLVGVLAVLGLPTLPPFQIFLLIALPLTMLSSLWRATRVLIFLFMGIGWCWWCAQSQLALRLTPELEGRTVAVSGWLASIPQKHTHFTSFEFAIQQLDGRAPGPGIPKLIRLSWSKVKRIPAPGEHWRFQVRLKRPRGYMNPGGFDYEGWLFRHGIGATGYVLGEQACYLGGAPRLPLLRTRNALFAAVLQALPDNSFAGIAAALVVGDRSAIDAGQWQVFQSTGTAHLLSISGLHIGLVAGLVFLLVRLLWRRSAWLCAQLPAPLAGVTAAILVASVYAALAGFSVPTQRALIMLTAISGANLLRRHSNPWDMLGLAMIAVLIVNPLSAGEVGFWLSFAAVAAIFYAFSGRLHANRGRIMQLVRTQWAVGIGLLPLMVFFFHRASLAAPIANLVSVPVYSLVVVPLVLVGAISLCIWPWAGGMLLKLATGVIALTWPLLEHLSSLPGARLVTAAPTLGYITVAAIGALWLMLPKHAPSRWLGAVLLLPLFLYTPPQIPKGGFNLALLDVGQGLSAVIRTSRHTLVYDTGPSFSEYFDTGEMVVIPWLQSHGIRAPDMTIVSHADNDHAGGLPSLQAAYVHMPVLSGEPSRVTGARACLRGQSWRWDGVSFEILAPGADESVSGNDASCVLRVRGIGGSALLVGDLMRRGEQRLLKLEGRALHSDVLVVPHHGSLTSSSEEFVKAVSPRIALFPVGYRNRWGFPKSRVVAIYRNDGADLLDTATSGAVDIRLWPGHDPEVVDRWRISGAHLWTAR